MNMKKTKKIALVAHDNCKKDLVEWAEWNWETLIKQQLVCTGTTGTLIVNALKIKIDDHNSHRNLNITKLKSGPLGGDQQLGALICEGEIDILIFFWVPMMPQPHDVDVKALLRISTLYNVVAACSRATADFIVSSHLMNEEYEPKIPDFSAYVNRKI